MQTERPKACKKCGGVVFNSSGSCLGCLARKPCVKCGALDRYEDGKCKVCSAARNKAYRDSHVEENRKYLREYYLSHKEELNEKAREWREKNLDLVRKIEREYREQHSSERNASRKRSRDKRIDQGLCTKCGKTVVPGLKTCEECTLKQRYKSYLGFFGISREEVKDLLQERGGGCEICGVPLRVAEGLERLLCDERAYLDHVAATGTIRGVLCIQCNAAIGQDERLRLKGMLEYLRKPRLAESFPRKRLRRECRLRWLESQDGKCAVCDQELNSERGGRIHLDHDHKTGLIRGVLCIRCNHILGDLRDDPKIIQAAIEYLNKHESALVQKKVSNG